MRIQLFGMLLVVLVSNGCGLRKGLARPEDQRLTAEQLATDRYTKEMNKVPFGKKILDFESTQTTAVLGDQYLQEYGFYVKKINEAEEYYRVGSDVPLTMWELTKQIWIERAVKFYSGNEGAYTHDYDCLVAIQVRNKAAGKSLVVLPKITSNGSLDLDEFRKVYVSDSDYSSTK